MTTSGTSTFIQTRDQLILDAFQLIGVYGLGRTVSGADSLVAQNALNKMIKAWGAQGLHLWTKSEGILYLTLNTAKYNLGNGATYAYCTDKNNEIKTLTTATVAAGATSISVSSTTGMAMNNYIGLVQTDGSLFWTTISSVTNSTTLALTAGPTVGCYSGAIVFTFSSYINKPMRINDARIVQGYDSGATSTEVSISMTSLPYQSYEELPDKTIQGLPIQFSYRPDNLYGTMKIWPRPNDCSTRVQFTYERILQDLNNASDNFDFPNEWLEAITWNLAMRLGPAFGKDQKVLQTIGPVAQQMLSDLKDWDTEITTVQMTPDLGY